MLANFIRQVGNIPRGPGRTRAIVAGIAISFGISLAVNMANIHYFSGSKFTVSPASVKLFLTFRVCVVA
jgi:hypothetical protein